MKKSKTDIGIEFARLIGCLIVIGVHISLADYENNYYDLSKGFINCLLADGVAIFWIITGCFLFKSHSYTKVLNRTGKTVVLPAAILSIFCFYFSGFLFGTETLAESFTYTSKDYLDVIRNTLELNPTIAGTQHLWFCYTYLLIMIAFPVIDRFVAWMDEDSKREKYFILITMLLFLVNDISKNMMLEFSLHSIRAGVPAIIEIIYGHILYKHKDEIINKIGRIKIILLTPLSFLFLNFVRMLTISITHNKQIVYWYSLCGLLCAISVILFSISIFNKHNTSSITSKLLSTLSSYTFLIYLLHFAVINVLSKYNIFDTLINKLSQYLDRTAFEIVYTIIAILIVFLVTLIVSIIVRTISNFIKKIINLTKKA